MICVMRCATTSTSPRLDAEARDFTADVEAALRAHDLENDEDRRGGDPGGVPARQVGGLAGELTLTMADPAASTGAASLARAGSVASLPCSANAAAPIESKAMRQRATRVDDDGRRMD